MARPRTGWPTTSRHERGYGTAWDKIRLVVLKRDNGLCQCDECQGGTKRVTLATEVHHIKPKAKGGTDDVDNLQSINTECHKRETAAADGKTLRPKVEIANDGWPVRVAR